MSRQRTIVYSLLILAIGFYCLDYFFRISPSLVLPELMKQYHTNPLGLGVFASAFYLGYVVFQIPGGYLLDRYSVKYPIAWIIVLCTICFIAFVFAQQFYLGVLLRFLIGASSAISFIGVLYVSRKYLPFEWLPFISGITIAIGTLAASIIQTASAALVGHISWHITLSIFAMWGFIIAVIIVALPLCGLRAEADISPPQEHILINLFGLIKNGRLLYNGLIGGLFYLPTSLLTAVWGITFFKASYGLSITESSSGIFLIFLGWAIGSPLVGWFGGRWPYNRSLVIVPALLAALVSYFMLFHSAALHDWIFPICFLFGLFSSAQVMVWKNFNVLCPLPLTGLGIAMTNMSIMFVVSIMHWVVGNAINVAYKNHATLNTQVYLHGLQWIPWLFVLVAVLTLFNRSTSSKY